MTVKIYKEMVQGSEEWFAIRCGLLTASEMKLIITGKSLVPANNDKSRAHLYELAAQRVTKHVEASYVSNDMLRGVDDEIEAKKVYADNYGEVHDAGFITNDKWGFMLGYSPDALVGDEGLIECKSRRQKFQMETITTGVMPAEYMLQIQTGLLVSERKWCDFVSYSGGMPMFKLRVLPDEDMQKAIIEIAAKFHEGLGVLVETYKKNAVGLPMTERRTEEEMY